MRSIVNPAPFVVDQSVSGSFVGSLRLPPHAEEHPKPVILCWRLETSIVTSEDWAAPPPHVPDPPSTPTVCTAPPSVGDIPASSPAPLDPPPLPELEPAPELDGPPEVEPLLEPDEPIEPEEVSELDPLEPDPLPELKTLPESEASTSPCGELPELLPHAPAIATRNTRHPVIAERGRTPLGAVSMLTPSLITQWLASPKSVAQMVCLSDLAAINRSAQDAGDSAPSSSKDPERVADSRSRVQRPYPAATMLA
jgi:hypothetical protein